MSRNDKQRIWVFGLCVLAVVWLSALAVPSVGQSTTSTGGSVTTAPGDPVAAMAGKKFTRGYAGDRRIAFTFDDGPHPRCSLKLIEILKRENVPATFFWVGEKVRDYPEIAKAVADGGFEIGSHSWSHPNLKKVSLDEARKQILDPQDLIEKTIGRRPHLFRPPGGATDAKVMQICKDNGLVVTMWSVDPRDWAQGATSQSIHDKVMEQAHDGAIVCMHATKERTVEALPGLIADLRAKGYSFATVSQLIDEASRHEGEAQSQGEGDESMGYGAPEAPATPLVISLDESSPK